MRMSGALLAVLALLVPVAPAAAARTDSPAYFWRWTDGSEARARTFDERRYDLPSRLPRLQVSSHPPTGGQRVTLQTRVQGGWHTEDSATTDGRGLVRLQLNPYCDDGAWCRDTFDYRLVVAGQTATIRVTFAR
jgi:hypothetical protein